MRRISAIVLLCVFFLYHMGYYGIYLLASQQLDDRWQQKAYDESLGEENLLHTSIPLAVPYQSNQQKYVPSSGKVEVDGNFYRVVKQRYANDTLHILYAQDTLQKELKKSVDQWMASIIPLPQPDADGQQLWINLTKNFLIHQTLCLDEPEKKFNLYPYGDVAIKHYEFISVVPIPPPQIS
ncbi:hypothetical protein WJR50_14195 [Catalinimonas sp. 4WD22]|uniref:hypothetical protein n=1 Tax=Catalinimonas locisalis TaxID=3133978 RepID=UPI00310123AA